MKYIRSFVLGLALLIGIVCLVRLMIPAPNVHVPESQQKEATHPLDKSEQIALLKQGVVAWNRWRAQNLDTYPDLSGADLKGVNLSGAYLAGTNLSGADLSKADLSGDDLSKADFTGARLKEARLKGAYLIRTNLSKADLSKADLKGAYLARTNLSKANLKGVDLKGVNLKEAIR